jgi:hypothetical protein
MDIFSSMLAWILRLSPPELPVAGPVRVQAGGRHGGSSSSAKKDNGNAASLAKAMYTIIMISMSDDDLSAHIYTHCCTTYVYAGQGARVDVVAGRVGAAKCGAVGGA